MVSGRQWCRLLLHCPLYRSASAPGALSVSLGGLACSLPVGLVFPTLLVHSSVAFTAGVNL
jgi:hypothetical protein